MAWIVSNHRLGPRDTIKSRIAGGGIVQIGRGEPAGGDSGRHGGPKRIGQRILFQQRVTRRRQRRPGSR